MLWAFLFETMSNEMPFLCEWIPCVESLDVTVFGATSLGLVLPHKIGGLGATFQREIF